MAIVQSLASIGRVKVYRQAMMLIGLILLACLPLQLSAQTSPLGVPSDRLDQNVVPSPSPPKAPVEPVEAAPAVWSLTPFRLDKVVVSGASLATGRIATAYQPFIGHVIDKEGMTELTKAIGAVYDKSSVALFAIQVPGQTFADHILRITVIEGHVEGADISSKLHGRRRALLQAYVHRLERDRPLRKSTLQRFASLIRDMPGLTPDLAFQPGSTPGAVRLVIGGKNTAIQATMRISNRGIALLGRTTMQADVYANGLLTGGDQIHAALLVPIGEASFRSIAATYTTPIDSNGTTLQTNIAYLTTRPPLFELEGRTLRLIGHSLSLGAQISHAFLRSETVNLTGTAGIDGISSQNALLGYTLSHDRIRTARLGLAFTRISDRAQTGLGITISAGLDALGARTAPGEAKRDFRKLNVRINHVRVVGRDFVVRLSGYGQFTGDALPASEQIALGGEEFGRAFPASLVAGDSGYAVSAELAWRRRSKLPASLRDSEIYVSADEGSARYRSRFGLPATTYRLASVAAGVRLHAGDKTVIELEVAHALKDPGYAMSQASARVTAGLRMTI